MEEEILDSPDHDNANLTYTRFPNEWTAEQVYEYLIARAEEDEKAVDDESGKAREPEET